MEENTSVVTKAKWLRQVAATHTKMGNKLINVARRMKANSSREVVSQRKEENTMLIQRTYNAYCEEAAKQSKRRQLNDQQQKQIKQ